MPEMKIKLGGMALSNGVLVHGPTSWACAVRTAAGKLKVASGPKPRVGISADLPILRGPARLLEAGLVPPRRRRGVSQGRVWFEGGDRAVRLEGQAPGAPGREGARRARHGAADPRRHG